MKTRDQIFEKRNKYDMYACVHSFYLHGIMDTNKSPGEEARQQLHKNAASNLEQVLAAIPHKTLTIRPPASHYENYPS